MWLSSIVAHILLSLLPLVLSGPNDTVDQLRVGFTKVPLADQVTNAEVTIEQGEVPSWISGTLARHACGVYGETGHPTDPPMLNAVDHVFDCIEMGQGYTFHNGTVTFTSNYYETKAVELWRRYEENMNQSSVWWRTVYATQNLTAVDHEDSMLDSIQHKSGSVPAVSWWQVGNEVVAMSEWPSGDVVDVHKMVNLGGYPYQDDGEDDFFGEGFRSQHSPAHEQMDADGRIWSSAAVHKYNGDIGENKRVVFTLDPATKKREFVGEWEFANTNLSLCNCPDAPFGTAMCERYPNSTGRLRQVHSMQMTEHYIIVPETNYMYDPCTRKNRNGSWGGWEAEYNYEKDAPGLVTFMNKTDGNVTAQIEVPAFMITHVLGAYEVPGESLLHFDALTFDDASPYTYYTYINVVLDGQPHPKNFSRVMRFTFNTNPWSFNGTKDLVAQNPDNEDICCSFEFTNINPEYQGKPYKYGYMTQNVFKLNGGVIKLNVDDGTIIRKEMPDGLFPTEPIFVKKPDATEEDDGVIVISGIDGGKKKGFLMVFDGKTMDILFHATAPKLSLFGVHSKFFALDVGCSLISGDCTPHDHPGAPSSTTAPPVTSPAPSVTSPAPPVTSAAPSVTSPAPSVTSAAPSVTSPAPSVTSTGSAPSDTTTGNSGNKLSQTQYVAFLFAFLICIFHQ